MKKFFKSEKKAKKEILQSKYVLDKLLGQGTNAQVMQGRDKKEGTLVAIKIMKTKKEIAEENKGRSSAVDEERMFQHEIHIMKTVKQRLPDHPHILKLISICTSDDPANPPERPCLVLEYLSGGELFDRIVSKSCYTEADAAALFYTLMETLGDLHNNGIIHRDLKPENIIFGASDEDVKICDFGTAKIVDDETSEDIYADFKVGSPGYFAPETIYKTYAPANDVWSMGCILYTLLAGYMPFNMDDPMLIVKLMTCRFDFHQEAWKDISEEAKDLIKQMLFMPYHDRITVEKVLEHDWFKTQKKLRKKKNQLELRGTVKRLKKLNIEQKANKNLIRQFMFDNAVFAKSKVVELINNNKASAIKNVNSFKDGIKKMASRKFSISEYSLTKSLSQSLTNSFRTNKNVGPFKQGKVELRKLGGPRNRQALLSDIRNPVNRKSVLRYEVEDDDSRDRNSAEEEELRLRITRGKKATKSKTYDEDEEGEIEEVSDNDDSSNYAYDQKGGRRKSNFEEMKVARHLPSL